MSLFNGPLALLCSLLGIGLAPTARACAEESRFQTTQFEDEAFVDDDGWRVTVTPIAPGDARPDPAAYAALDAVEPGSEAAWVAVDAEPAEIWAATESPPLDEILPDRESRLAIAAPAAPVADRAADAVAEPSPAEAPLFAASQEDKVLMGLETVTSPEWEEEGWLLPRPERIVVDPVAAEAADAEAERPEPPLGPQLVALGPARLDGLRGGYSVPGLQISFGIERAVYVNGQLVTTTSLQVNGGGAPGAAAAGSLSPGTLALIQSGSGNRVLPQIQLGSGAATVIQNSLDHQRLQAVTSITATVNSLQWLRGLDLQTQLRSAITDSLRR